jgi:hypothetical protein
LGRPELAVNWLVVMYPVEKDGADLLPEFVRVALNVRKQRIEIDQCRCLYVTDGSGIVAFERVDQQ